MSKAVFTIVRDERYFLPVWMRHYLKYFAPKDIYVMDNGTVDGSTQNIDCNVIDTPHEYAFDVNWLVATVEDMQRELLKKYDIVLFAEADEIVYPESESFEQPLAGGPCVCCSGYTVLHDPKEPALNWNKPILRQRKYWVPDSLEDKPLLSRVPLSWCFGFHHCETPYPVDPGLYLIHLSRVDFSYYRQRYHERSRWPRPPGQDPGLAFQWSPGTDMEGCFLAGWDRRQIIPDKVKDAV